MRTGVKKFLVVAVLGVALAAGFAFWGNARQSEAASGRDCDTNSIDYKNLNGGCGALTPSEMVADIKDNQPSDLKTFYNHFGLTAGNYDRFAKTAKAGTVHNDGRVVVNGQTVMTDAHSYGREKFNGQRKAITIGGKVYYYSSTKYSFASGTTSLPVMVMFDSKGVPEVVIINACGNPVTGKPVKPTYSCKALNMKSLGNDTYSFTSQVTYSNNAKFDKVVYDFGDGSTPVTKTNPSEAVPHKFTKSATIKVTAHFTLPGGQKVAVTSEACAKKVVVKPPFYKCVVLTPRAMNEQKTKFRFTVTTSQGNGAALKNADFTVDGKVANRGVTTKDAEGKIYQEYSFDDGKEHVIVATVNFNLAGGVKSVTCQAKVTAGKKPMCPIPGKEHIPAEDVEKCKEDTPPPTPPETPEELPDTGVGSILGIFAATSVGGAIAHRFVWSRRFNR